MIKMFCIMRVSKGGIFILLLLYISIIILGCKQNKNLDLPAINTGLTPYEIKYPNYIPIINMPSDNPLSFEGVALGRKLYYDPILSNNGKSCSSCHEKATAFTTFAANAIPHINEAWNNVFLWRGGIEGTLEDAMYFEVNEFFATDISKLNSDAEYKMLFKNVYNIEEISQTDIAKALAQYLRSLVSLNSTFDQYLQKKTMLTASELNGLYIFNSEKGECFHCHSLGLFQDNSFHNIGIDSIFEGVNMGRFMVTADLADMGKFKTPTLRNVALTAPYMHDGRFQTLEQVVEQYNSGVKKSSTLDPIMAKPSFEHGLQLTPQEKIDLISFLHSLTDTSFINNANH
jgi:cytochrome c peroxidase